MKIYQLKTAKEFADYFKDSNLSQEELMQMYAKDVAKKFAAECVNEALGNKMEVSNALHSKIEKEYNSIIWDGGQWVPTSGSQCEDYHNETFNTTEK